MKKKSSQYYIDRFEEMGTAPLGMDEFRDERMRQMGVLSKRDIYVESNNDLPRKGIFTGRWDTKLAHLKYAEYVDRLKDMGTQPFDVDNTKTQKIMDYWAAQDSYVEQNNNMARKFGTSGWNDKLASLNKEAISFGSRHRMSRALEGKDPDVNVKEEAARAGRAAKKELTTESLKKRKRQAKEFIRKDIETGSKNVSRRAGAVKDVAKKSLKGLGRTATAPIRKIYDSSSHGSMRAAVENSKRTPIVKNRADGKTLGERVGKVLKGGVDALKKKTNKVRFGANKNESVANKALGLVKKSEKKPKLKKFKVKKDERSGTAPRPTVFMDSKRHVANHEAIR